MTMTDGTLNHRKPLQLAPQSEVKREKEVSCLVAFESRLNTIPDYFRGAALGWLPVCDTDSERENVLDFVEYIAQSLTALPEGVRILCLRELFRLHEKAIRSGSGLNKLRTDLGWLEQNVVPLMPLGKSAPSMMRVLLRRRFNRLSRRDVWLLAEAIAIQAAALGLIGAILHRSVVNDPTATVIAIQGIGLLAAAWLTGKCEGINRSKWNDIMAGFALASVLLPFAVMAYVSLK